MFNHKTEQPVNVSRTDTRWVFRNSYLVSSIVPPRRVYFKQIVRCGDDYDLGHLGVVSEGFRSGGASPQLYIVVVRSASVPAVLRRGLWFLCLLTQGLCN